MCFLVIYAFVSAFFGAPYNGVYKFSAVFYPGVELETKVDCCPVKHGGPVHWKRSRPHISQRQTIFSLIICLMLSGEIPNYIIKFICVRLLMLRFFCFFNQLLITSNYTFSVRIYSSCFFLLMSLLWAKSSATLRGMIVNLFSLGQFMIFLLIFYYFFVGQWV